MFFVVHWNHLQPIYSHWLYYISICNLVVIVAANGSTYDTHWHWGVQFEIKYCFGLYYVQPNYSWKCNTVKSCTEYCQDICSALVTQYAQFWETLFHKWSNNAVSSCNIFILVQNCLLPWFSNPLARCRLLNFTLQCLQTKYIYSLGKWIPYP